MELHGRIIRPLKRSEIRSMRKNGLDLIRKFSLGDKWEVTGDDVDAILDAAFPGDEMDDIGMAARLEIMLATITATADGAIEKN